MTHVRWGILGAAKFAREHMGPALHMARGGALAALATSSPDKAVPFRARVPGLRLHDGYEALLADPDIDAVYIPLPNHLHVDWTLKALAAGKHVLCEKPIAMRATEIDRLIAARDASGRLAAEAFMIVHHPQWHEARRLYRDGALGRVRRVSAVFSYDNSADPGNIRNSAGCGGGALPDIGVYAFGAVRFVTEEEPDAILSTRIERERGVDVWSHVTAQFPSFHYTGIVSMRMQPWQEVVFHGDRAVMRLTAPFNAGVYGEARIEVQTVSGGDLSVSTRRYPADNHYVLQVEAFNASVLEGRPFPCPLEFSRGTQEMIDRVFDHDTASRAG